MLMKNYKTPHSPSQFQLQLRGLPQLLHAYYASLCRPLFYCTPSLLDQQLMLLLTELNHEMLNQRIQPTTLTFKRPPIDVPN